MEVGWIIVLVLLTLVTCFIEFRLDPARQKDLADQKIAGRETPEPQHIREIHNKLLSGQKASTMVELVEVEDESFETKQPGPSDNEDDYYTDTDSEISSDDEDTTIPDETLADRLRALKDIIPPTTRSFFSSAASTTTSYVQSGMIFSGKALFVLSTSALLLGVPWALAFAEEQQVLEMEKEMKMREMGGEILSSGTTAAALNAQLGTQQGKPAL